MVAQPLREFNAKAVCGLAESYPRGLRRNVPGKMASCGSMALTDARGYFDHSFHLAYEITCEGLRSALARPLYVHQQRLRIDIQF